MIRKRYNYPKPPTRDIKTETDWDVNGKQSYEQNLVNNYECSLPQNNQAVTFRKVSLTNYLY